MSVLTVYLGLEDKGIWLDTPLGTVGDRGTITVDSEQMAVIYGFGTTYLFVERGDGGTTAAPHVIGTTVTADITSLNSTPTLAEVLAEGNEGPADTEALIKGAAGQAAAIQGAPTGDPPFFSRVEAGPDGNVYVTTGSFTGGEALGQALLSAAFGALVWQPLIIVQSPTPTTVYITPLVLADAGLYAWTGAAYEKIGDTPS